MDAHKTWYEHHVSVGCVTFILFNPPLENSDVTCLSIAFVTRFEAGFLSRQESHYRHFVWSILIFTQIQKSNS